MKIKVGVIQDAPVFFDKAATLDKVERLVKKQAQAGCNLILFPESFIPGYPRGFDFGATIGRRTSAGRQLYATYYEQSFDLDSEDLSRLEELAKSQETYLVIGVSEKRRMRAESSGLSGSLYCSMLYISPKDGLMGVHRKIKPTGTERLVWSEAGGESLVSFDTELGKLGGLICWENYMPLARMSMYQQGVEIYLAPTADSRPQWTSTMQHIALEGRCFVLGSNQYFTKAMYPENYQQLLEEEADEICPGGSVIVSPLGEIIAGPLFGEAGVLTAEIELGDIIEAKLDFDVIGHYARPDLFQFSVSNQPKIKIESGSLK